MTPRISLCLLLLLACAPATFAQKTVTVSGEAEGTDLAAKDRALEDAFRKAIEKGVGTYISSQSETKDFTLIRDKIFAEAKGLVKSYKILSVSKNGGITKVTITATVLSDVFRNRWDAIRNLIHRKKRPRLMWLIYEMGPSHKPAGTGHHAFVTYAARTLTSHMEEYFLKRRFFIVDREQFMTLKKAELQASTLESNLPRLVAMGRSQGAEIIVYGYVKPSRGRIVTVPGTNFKALTYQVDIAAKAIRADSAKVIVSMSRSYTGTGMNLDAAKAAAFKKAGKGYSKLLMKRILRSWILDVNSASNIKLEVSKISFIQVIKLQTFLKKQRWIGQLSDRSYSNKVKIWDIESKLSPNDLAMKMATAKIPGLKIEIAGITANTIRAVVKSDDDE